jgi:tRNA threonylcarbamoyladenosine biosynthesis protein TsaE
MTEWVYYSVTPEATQSLARHLARLLRAGDFLALLGELGGGKTCFVQGLAEGLGVQGRVSSPTFVLLHYHPGPLPLVHLDAYRVASAEEFRDLGVEEYARTSVIALEWADRVPDLWPVEALTIRFAYAENGRRIEFAGRGERPRALVVELRQYDPGP